MESPPTVSVADLLSLWPQVAKHFKLLILNISLTAWMWGENLKVVKLERWKESGKDETLVNIINFFSALRVTE